MRIWTGLVTALLVLGLSSVAPAARNKADKPARAKKHDAVSGKVESVAADGKSFTLKKGKKGGTVTETLADTTKVMTKTGKHAKAQPGTAAAIQAGKHVRVRPASGTAQKIVVRDSAKAGKHAAKGKHHKKAKAAA
jgi:hypothetical protein